LADRSARFLVAKNTVELDLDYHGSLVYSVIEKI